jgi:hypothetical protein
MPWAVIRHRIYCKFVRVWVRRRMLMKSSELKVNTKPATNVVFSDR